MNEKLTRVCDCGQVLCAMLEYDVTDSSDLKMQIITTLQSTSRGKGMYAALCEQQIALKELVSLRSTRCCLKKNISNHFIFVIIKIKWDFVT